MTGNDGLVGRQRELAELHAFLGAAGAGEGGLLLVAGEAGVGKTALVDQALQAASLAILRGSGSEDSTTPYGPLVQALRAYLRRTPAGLAGSGPMERLLAILMPELGRTGNATDRATLVEAIRWAFATAAADQPAAVVLDDLQWADETTLALLPALVAGLKGEALALIGVYRSDEVLRGHQLRRARTELRRGGRLRELSVEPLDARATATLCENLLGEPVGPSLTRAIFDRTQGLPFFIEELLAALAAEDALRAGPNGLDLGAIEEMPIPDTVREAVLVRLDRLDDAARSAVEVAAAIGTRFPCELVTALDPEAELDQAIARGFVVELGAHEAAFRHALAREATYGELPWGRRRELHRAIAEWWEARGAPSTKVAEHWLAARELERALPTLVAAVGESCRMHAYRDALRTGRKALEIWPEGVDEEERLALLTQLGECAELSADLPEALKAWREVADAHRAAGEMLGLARIQSRLARAYELECQWDAALAARQEAARAFDVTGSPGHAAAELLAAAGHVQAAGRFSSALELINTARDSARQADRKDLEARALGLEGQVLAKAGRAEQALTVAREGLSLALAAEQVAAAAECYDRVGMVFSETAEYADALDAFAEATGFCSTHGETARQQGCLACVAWLTQKTGEWDRSIEVSRELLDDPEAPRNAHLAARWQLGTIEVLRGNTKRGRRLLERANADAERTASLDALVETTCALARADEDEGAREGALAGAQRVIELSRGEGNSEGAPTSSIAPCLRWVSTLFATAEDRARVAACAEVLARAVDPSSHREALAALSHALGELALLDGAPEDAARHLTQALELQRELGLPFDRAETQLRAGAALAAAGEQELGVERLVEGYRAARKLGAKPLA
nr:AAA family ATPase [Actinomycetota bacterium]